MNAASTQPSVLHRAALVLHGLADADRAWVLQALPAEQQERLRPLLHELAELGIPGDATLLRPLVQRLRPEEPDAGVELLETVEQRELASLAVLLAAEPPRVVAALLAARSWRWRERLLGRLPAALAAEIRALAPPHGDALQAAVLARVAARLEAHRRPAPRLHAWWSRLAAGAVLVLSGVRR